MEQKEKLENDIQAMLNDYDNGFMDKNEIIVELCHYVIDRAETAVKNHKAQIANGNQVDFFVIKNLAEDIYENAKQKGFWEDINIAEKLMLIVSELGEALEADRKNKSCRVSIDEVFNFENDKDFQKHFAEKVKDTFEDEIADAFIRILDLSTHLNFDLMKHVIAKHRFNKTRPYKHGKKY